jgi:hypothetical protein
MLLFDGSRRGKGGKSLALDFAQVVAQELENAGRFPRAGGADHQQNVLALDLLLHFLGLSDQTLQLKHVDGHYLPSYHAEQLVAAFNLLLAPFDELL